jgi:ABC-type nitrate/sulfonate/bicarbonate transport system ATPase subunit
MTVRTPAAPETATSGLAGTPAIRLRQVAYSYPNGTEALRGLDLDIERGSVHSVVGPSGCGKSTMLHVLSGLSQPSGGTVSYDLDTSGSRHPLTMVFQKDTLLPWLTVAGNVALFFRFHPIAKAEQRERVDWLLRLAGLEQFANAYPYQLSGGMRRRVAFLSAIAPLPGVLLLDEPFSSLDEPTRIAIHQDVYKILRELKITCLIVTHDLAEASSLSDVVTILTARPGRVAQQHRVPFGESRNMLELRQTQPFLDLYGRLWHDLSLQIEKGRKAS